MIGQKPKKATAPVAKELRVGNFLRETAVVKEYPVSRAWLRKTRIRIRNGQTNAGPPFIEIGRRLILYERCRLEEWLRQQEFGANGNGAE